MARDPEATVRSLMDHLDQSVRDAKAAARHKRDADAGTAEAPQLTPVDDQQRDRVINEAVSAAYYEGLRAGVRRYARWDAGVKVVGSGQFTLDEALARIDADEAAGEWQPS